MKTLLLIPLLLLGCVQVPKTTIRIPTEHGVVMIEAPKDSRIAGLKANFEKGTVTLDSYEARMNPDVISASAVGQVELIQAYGVLANSMAEMGMRALASSQGIPLTSAPPQPTPAPTNITITPDQWNTMTQKLSKDLVNAYRRAQVTNQTPEMRGPRGRRGITNSVPVLPP